MFTTLFFPGHAVGQHNIASGHPDVPLPTVHGGRIGSDQPGKQRRVRRWWWRRRTEAEETRGRLNPVAHIHTQVRTVVHVNAAGRSQAMKY